MDPVTGEPHGPRPYAACRFAARRFPSGQRRTVAHERNYEEVRDLVLLLAAQPIGKGLAERLKRIVVLSDHR